MKAGDRILAVDGAAGAIEVPLWPRRREDLTVGLAVAVLMITDSAVDQTHRRQSSLGIALRVPLAF